MPVIRARSSRAGQGDWADSLLELDTDFGTLLDLLEERTGNGHQTAILCQKAGLPTLLGHKFIRRAMAEAFDDWEQRATRGNGSVAGLCSSTVTTGCCPARPRTRACPGRACRSVTQCTTASSA
jgi:hypothetical protein